MRAFLVAGGSVSGEFLLRTYREKKWDLVIAIDGGGKHLSDCGIVPHVLMGDFDTLEETLYREYERKGVKIIGFDSHKDETDTELALSHAVREGCDEICLCGATGSRLDHVMGNLQSLRIPFSQGVFAYMLDANNRIRYVEKEDSIAKADQYGTYVSFVPMSEQVRDVTLKGFVYPLKGATLTNERSLAISNQIVDDVAYVSHGEGTLLMIESRD